MKKKKTSFSVTLKSRIQNPRLGNFFSLETVNQIHKLCFFFLKTPYSLLRLMGSHGNLSANQWKSQYPHPKPVWKSCRLVRGAPRQGPLLEFNLPLSDGFKINEYHVLVLALVPQS